MPSAVPPPPEAFEVFGSALETACQFAEILATDGVQRGLIGPRETPRLWDRHLLNCAVGRRAAAGSRRARRHRVRCGAARRGARHAPPRNSRGAARAAAPPFGLPRGVRWRGWTCRTPPSSAVAPKTWRGPSEADIATARAVAPLDRLAGWAAGLLRPGGEILAIKGQSAEQELAAARPVLSRLRVRSAEVLRVGQGRVVPATTVVRVVIGGHGREEQPGAHRSRRGVA